ncbi:MAG TPA: VOC family protein [Longimicrobiales bacterium]|nr:VOC family protein [Longimicrobiales bacterium]
MLNQKDAIATVAVRDIPRAKRFYEDVLGFKLVHDEGGEALTYKSGNSSIFVYKSEYAGTNQATAASWDVGTETDSIVRELKRKGVNFEHYDLPDTKREGDVHVGDGMKIAWFKDPDGNILSVFGQ